MGRTERMFCLLWNAHERQSAVDNMRDAVAAHSQADAITGFMHRTGENRSAQFRAAAMRGSAATSLPRRRRRRLLASAKPWVDVEASQGSRDAAWDKHVR